MKIYLAGPMTGMPEANYPAFDDAATRIATFTGWEVVNPADLDRAAGEPHKDGDEFWRRALRRDIAALAACDSIALLDGWEDSKGARFELYVASTLGLTVYQWDATDGELYERKAEQESVLAEAEHLINGPRQHSYSHPSEDYGRTVALFNSWRGAGSTPLTVEEAVMFMVFVKLSRQRHRHKRDNLVDAAGYIGCLAKVIGEDR